MRNHHSLGAEFLGTFWLVLGGCGAAVFAGPTIGDLGVALAFGLSVVTMAYAVGHISGGHFNPAVTIGLATAGRVGWQDVTGYVISQIAGASGAAAVLWVVAHGRRGFDATNNFALNGYGDHSPAHYSLWAVLLAELVLTVFFLMVILGVTDTRAPKGFAPLAIGLALTVIHLISIPISNTSVNPARSIGPALFGGGAALGQLWVFVVAPTAGAVIAGLIYGRLLEDSDNSSLEEATRP